MNGSRMMFLNNLRELDVNIVCEVFVNSFEGLFVNVFVNGL